MGFIKKGEPNQITKERMILPIALSVSTFLLLFGLEDIPGLHRDEAIFGLFAERILKGLRPLVGYFNHYTSPLHSYLIAICFGIFGKSIFTLRLSGVILNLFSLWIYYDLTKRLFPKFALIGLIFLISLPFYAIFSRTAGDVFALNPFFLLLGVSFFLRGNKTPIFLTLSGVVFALGIWNHVIFLPTLIAVMLVYLLVAGPSFVCLLQKSVFVLPGIFIGFIPKLFGVFYFHYPFIEMPKKVDVLPVDWKTSFLNFIYALSGDGLFLRLVGKISLFTQPVFYGLVVIMVLVAFKMKKFLSFKNPPVFLALLIAFSFLLTALSNANPMLIGFRLWLLPLWIFPIWLASLVSEEGWKRKLLVFSFIGVNVASLITNYFMAYKREGGRTYSNIYVGGRNDNSFDFVDSRELLPHLKGYEKIYLLKQFYHQVFFNLNDLERLKVERLSYDETTHFPLGSLIVLYKKEGGISKSPRRFGTSQTQLIKKDELRHFVLYEVIEEVIPIATS